MATQIITLTSAGVNSGPNYAIYWSSDCVNYNLLTGSSPIFLPSVGSTASVDLPLTTTCISLRNINSVCNNELTTSVQLCPTPTTTTTSTTTIAPTTTTSTTSTTTTSTTSTSTTTTTQPPSTTTTTGTPQSQWTASNYDCGGGTLNDVGINGSFMGTLSGPSTFPLTSTLYGYKTNPNGINYGGSNTIQANVTTNIAGTGNCAVLRVEINGVTPTPYETYFTSNPFPQVSGVVINPGDQVWVYVQCYSGSCPSTTTTTTTTTTSTTSTTTTSTTTTTQAPTTTTTTLCNTTSSLIYFCDTYDGLPQGCSSSVDACSAALSSSVYFTGTLQNGTLLYNGQCITQTCDNPFNYYGPNWFRIGNQVFYLTGSCNNEVSQLTGCCECWTVVNEDTVSINYTYTDCGGAQSSPNLIAGGVRKHCIEAGTIFVVNSPIGGLLGEYDCMTSCSGSPTECPDCSPSASTTTTTTSTTTTSTTTTTAAPPPTTTTTSTTTTTNCPATIYTHGAVRATCSDYCTTNYLIQTTNCADNNYSNLTIGDFIYGISGPGFVAYSNVSTDTTTGPFRIAEIDANGEVIDILVCSGGSCIPL